MLRVENVATPFTAVTILVPESVPPAGLVPSEIVLPAVVLLGWTVKTRCVAGGGGGLSASTVASHVPTRGSWSKNHVHCGSTEPALACTANSPSVLIAPLDIAPLFRGVKSAGEVIPTTRFAIVAPYASAPALTSMAPGSAIVAVEPEPDATACAPKARSNTASTPVYEEIRIPPSAISAEKVASTTRVFSPLGNVPSGKFCTFVATNVAIAMSSAVTYVTRW